MKALILMLYFLFSINFITAGQQVRYKNNNDYYVEKDSAVYTEIIGVMDPVTKLYLVEIYYKNGKIKSRGTSTSNNNIDYIGRRITYFENGKKKEILNYNSRRLEGQAYYYYPNGALFRVIEYTDDFKSINQVINANVKIKSAMDSTGLELVKDGNGYFVEYGTDFNSIEREGPIVNNKWEGEVKGYYAPMDLHYVEIYKKGKLISGISTNKKAEHFAYKTASAPPIYPGSFAAFERYIYKIVKRHKANIKGRVNLSFLIDKDGKLSDPEIARELDPGLNEEIFLGLSKSPLWEPCKQYGIVISTRMNLTISFNIDGVSTIDVPPSTVRNWDGIKYRVN